MDQRAEKHQLPEAKVSHFWVRPLVEACRTLLRAVNPNSDNKYQGIHLDPDKVDYKRDPLVP